MEGTVSERPTMAQAFAADIAPVAASLPATPSAESQPADSASADATVPPATEAPETAIQPNTDADVGPMPLERHKKILDGVYKERDDAKQQLESWKAYEWAKTVDRAAIEQAQQLGQLYQQDRAGYVRQLLAEAVTDPTLAPIVRSEAARILGSRTANPDIPIVDEKGQVVGSLNDILQQRLDAELKPLKADLDTRKERERAEQQQRELQQSVTDIYAEAVELLPHFKEHEAEIGKVFATLNGDDPAKDLRKAWKTVVGPKLSAQAKAEVLDSLKTKAAATTVNPSSAVVVLYGPGAEVVSGV